MKIINLKQFLDMPKGTVFSKYEPCCFTGLMIKDMNCGDIDFYYMTLLGNVDSNDTGDFFDKCEEAQKTGKSLKLDFDVIGRDAAYNKDQLFAIYEEEDIKGLVKSLTNYESKY
jgi:hypothetical protein